MKRPKKRVLSEEEITRINRVFSGRPPVGVGYTRKSKGGRKKKLSTVVLNYNLVIGAEYEPRGSDSQVGAAYVYDVNQLSEDPYKIAPPADIAEFNNFGREVAITSSHVIVATYEYNANRGGVWLYDRTNLSAAPTKLQGENTGDRFGWSIAAKGDTLVVGATDWDNTDVSPNVNNSGKVYIYDLTNLSASPTTLQDDAGAENNRFGYDVNISDDDIYVAARVSADEQNGKLYLYDRTNLSAAPTTRDGGIFSGSFASTGTFSALSPDGLNLVVSETNRLIDLNTSDLTTDLGTIYSAGTPTSVSSNDTYLVWGRTSGDDNSLTNSGEAFIAPWSNLLSETEFYSGALQSNSGFGSSICIAGNFVVVGSELAETGSPQVTDTGAAFVYSVTNVSGTPTLITPGVANSRFGSSMAGL